MVRAPQYPARAPVCADVLDDRGRSTVKQVLTQRISIAGRVCTGRLAAASGSPPNYRSNMASLETIGNFEFRTGLSCYRRISAKGSAAVWNEGSIPNRHRSSCWISNSSMEVRLLSMRAWSSPGQCVFGHEQIARTEGGRAFQQ
jgi:hypothetical protein